MIHFETCFFKKNNFAFTLLAAISNVSSYNEGFSCDTNIILGLQLNLFSLLETGTIKCLAVLL